MDNSLFRLHAGRKKRVARKDYVSREIPVVAPENVSEDPRKNYATSAVVFNDAQFWRRQMRQIYYSAADYEKYWFLDLVVLVHHTKKANLGSAIEDPKTPEFLQRKRGEFDFARNLAKILGHLKRRERSLVAFEGFARFAVEELPDTPEKAHFISSILTLLPLLASLHPDAARSDREATSSASTTEPNNFLDRNVVYETRTLSLRVDGLWKVFAPELRSGMMSTAHRAQERKLKPPAKLTHTYAVSVREPVNSKAHDSVLKIITNAMGGETVEKGLQSPDRLREALGGKLFGWMERTERGRKWIEGEGEGDPPVWVIPKDQNRKDGDQVVLVRVVFGADSIEVETEVRG